MPRILKYVSLAHTSLPNSRYNPNLYWSLPRSFIFMLSPNSFDRNSNISVSWPTIHGVGFEYTIFLESQPASKLLENDTESTLKIYPQPNFFHLPWLWSLALSSLSQVTMIGSLHSHCSPQSTLKTVLYFRDSLLKCTSGQIMLLLQPCNGFHLPQSGTRHFVMVCVVPYALLPHNYFYEPSPTPLLFLLQPICPSFSSFNTLDMFLPQDLCTACAPCLECSYLDNFLNNPFTSIKQMSPFLKMNNCNSNSTLSSTPLFHFFFYSHYFSLSNPVMYYIFMVYYLFLPAGLNSIRNFCFVCSFISSVKKRAWHIVHALILNK